MTMNPTGGHDMAEAETTRPECVRDKHLTFLDGLQKSGVTNMYGAPQYIEEAFGVDYTEARSITTYWMQSYGNPDR